MGADSASTTAVRLEAFRDCCAAVLEPIIESLDEAALDAPLSQVDELASYHYLQRFMLAGP
jgi:hypothetical protein